MKKLRRQGKAKRNYRAEYKRRIQRALSKGLSKTQARGHRRSKEPAVSKRAMSHLEDAKLQMGLRYLRKEKSFARAAKEAAISPERLRTHALESGIIEKKGRRWVIKHDLPRRVLIFTNGREQQITVGDFSEASLVGKYMSAVGWFVRTNAIRRLRPYIGKSVTDIDGTRYLLETRPNALHRVLHSGVSSFEQVYRIVV